MMKSFLAVILFITSTSLFGQPASFEELEFEVDSISTPYKHRGANFAFVRSKRGTSGVVKTSKADSILSFPITEIVLVFSELTPAAIEEREEANRERWENLMLTYPELFQLSTTYKNICQCNNSGDAEAFKQNQGFYVYFKGEEPKAKVVEAKKVEEKKIEKNPPPAKTEKAPEKEVAVVDHTAVKTKEPPVKELQKVSEPVVATETPEETPAAAEKEVVKESPKKKAEVAKPRKSKDRKACRPACYGYGDEDLIAFFKDNITLTKKQKRKGKKYVGLVKLQLHFDGTIKKAVVTGENEEFNQLVQGAVNTMNRWNPTVKNGTAIKSEVKITLKFDKEWRCIKPSEVAVMPRPMPKCKCATDAEIFGSAD